MCTSICILGRWSVFVSVRAKACRVCAAAHRCSSIQKCMGVLAYECTMYLDAKTKSFSRPPCFGCYSAANIAHLLGLTQLFTDLIPILKPK